MTETIITPENLLTKAEELRGGLSTGFRDEIVKSLYSEAEKVATRAVKTRDDERYDLDQRIDKYVTSPIYGLPIMLIVLEVIIWITVIGVNVVSARIAAPLFWIGELGKMIFETIGMPWWITGFIWDGVYLGLAWVVSFMLPPMMIFFPCFTIMEDLGYLPRVAFNLDWLVRGGGPRARHRDPARRPGDEDGEPRDGRRN